MSCRKSGLFTTAVSCLSLAAAAIAADPAAADKKFPWQPNALDAFVKAVEEHKPMVAVFTNPAAPGEKTLSTKCLADIEADGLKEFRDKAVFVNVQFHPEGSELRDDYGFRIARHLKLTDVPTVSFIAPNTDLLTEGYRTEGDFPIDEIKKDMAIGIKQAMLSKHTWCPDSPADLIRQLGESFREGNRAKYALCFAEPVQTAMKNLSKAQTAVGDAKRRLLKAIDAAFGEQAERLVFVDDDAEMIQELRQVTKAELLEAAVNDGKITVRFQTTKLERNGTLKKHEETVVVVEEGHGWRLQPGNAESVAQNINRQTDVLSKLPQDFDRIAEDVAAGKIASADAARTAATEAYSARKSVSVEREK